MLGAAGWGKTTALAGWSRNRRTGWVRCDEPDLDPFRFVHALHDAVRGLLPEGAGGTVPSGPGGLESALAGVRALCCQLRRARRDDVVLVIDDLEVVRSGSDVARLTEALCRAAPEHLHLVLVSRRELPFSLARLRGQGLVIEIDARDLAFDTAEVEVLLRAHAGPDTASCAELVRERTGGWPAAVLSAVELIRGHGPGDPTTALDELSRPGERFHTYLAEEVLAAEPAPTVDLLRRLAVYGEVGSVDVVGTGGEDGDAPAALADLIRRGLVRCGTRNPALRSLVPPLADYFRHDPTLTAGDRALLEVSAAHHWAARQDHAEALRHLIAGGAHAAAAALLVEHGSTLIARGLIDAVLEATRLPARHLDDPRAQCLLGHALQVRGRWSEAMDRFRDADRDDVLDPALAWRLGTLLLGRGELAEVLAVCGRVSRPDDPGVGTDEDVRVAALAATALRRTGNLDAARAEIARVEAGERAVEPRVRGWVGQVRALLAAADGNRRKADAHWADALEVAEGAGDLLEAVGIRCGRARHRLDVGAVADAASDAAVAGRAGRTWGSPFLVALAATLEGRVAVRRGRLDAAQQSLDEAVELLLRLGSNVVVEPLCGLGDLYRVRGRPGRSRHAYEEALTLAESAGDVPGIRTALIGLARARAEADDLDAARALADRACQAGADRQLEVPAVLTRGWVALLGEDREAAARDAARAAAAARARRDRPGVAEAITLGLLAVADRGVRPGLFDEAIEIYREAGCELEESAVRIIAARTGAGPAATVAQERLRAAGVDLGSAWVVGPATVTARFVPALSVRALGAFQVLRDGVPVPRAEWQSRKARDLLKILVARRRPVARDQLVELLWPEVDPARAGGRLSVLLSMLRGVLASADEADNLVVTDGGAIGLDLTRVHVDVEQFLAEADVALRAHRNGCPDAVVRLQATVADYTGAFLEDDPFPDWATPLAEQLRATHIALLQALAGQLRRTGDVDGVVRCTLRLLEQDPYDETAHLTLVDVLTTAGRRGEARRHYRNYVRRMGEIGVAPRAESGPEDPPPALARRRPG